MSSLFFLLYLYIKKRHCYPISDWITKAEYSVVPLCIIIPVTRYNLLTLSEPNSFFCNVKTTSRLTIDFSGMLPGDITKHHLPHLTCLRLSVIRFLLWPVLFYAFLFFIYLKFYSFFYKISRDNLYIFHNYRYIFLYNIYNCKSRQCFARTVSPNLTRTIAILINNAFKTVQQSAKDKEDICRRADRTAKISDAGFHTLMGWIKMHYFRGLL